jgi:hypothetical protein
VSDADISEDTSGYEEADLSSDNYDEFCAFIDKNVHPENESIAAAFDHCGTTTMTLMDLVNMDEAFSHLLLPY